MIRVVNLDLMGIFEWYQERAVAFVVPVPFSLVVSGCTGGV